MIFPVLETEAVVQFGDMTRLSAVKSFVSKDEPEITKVEIQSSGTGDWIDVTGNGPTDWYLDWKYPLDVSGTVTASVRITTSGGNASATKDISLLTSTDDHLFSGDADLVPFEPDIMNWVYPGRASFLNVHRAAQTRIIEMLDEMGLTDDAGLKLTKDAVVDISEVRAWSRDLTLHLIFKTLINAVDDVFTAKSKYYAGEASKRQQRAVLRLDTDGDGVTDTPGISTMTMELTRR